jgi:hypothetical protein
VWRVSRHDGLPQIGLTRPAKSPRITMQQIRCDGNIPACLLRTFWKLSERDIASVAGSEVQARGTRPPTRLAAAGKVPLDSHLLLQLHLPRCLPYAIWALPCNLHRLSLMRVRGLEGSIQAPDIPQAGEVPLLRLFPSELGPI